MSQSQRPGGLTALAVINFVLGGFGSLGIIVSVLFYSFSDELFDAATGAELSSAEVMIQFILSLVTAVLLIASGVGYLGQRKMLGFILGNLYGVVGLASSVIGIMLYEFETINLLGFIYPIMTLLLLQIVFKDDFEAR